MWEVISELVAGGTTLLLTTQYMEEADRLADDIVVIDRGKVIAHGTADQLKAQVGGERIELTVSDRAQLEVAAEVLSALTSGPVVTDPQSRSLTAPVTGGARRLTEALRELDERAIGLDDVGLHRPTLDDVFLTLTGHAAEETERGGPGVSALSIVGDGVIVARRNLIKIKRVPELLVFTTLSPIMFVLLFAYVFGGAIAGGDPQLYREFLIAGIFAQTVIFGATITGAGLAEDVQKGIIDRFRSLPMAPSAVLTGRTLSDVMNNVIVLVVMSLTGLIVGWRIRSSFWEAVGGYLILLLFAYAISWVMAFVGLLVPSVEVVNQAAFIVIFPITFIANTFVPLESLPGPLEVFAEWNPISAITQAARNLFGNDALVAEPTVWPLQHPVLYTVIWTGIILVIFIPLTNLQYRRATSR